MTTFKYSFTVEAPVTAVSPHKTKVNEHIEYSHNAGWQGLFTRLLFHNAGLYLLFTARKLITRYHVQKNTQATI